MSRLILDFLARRWWLYASIGFFGMLGITTGQPFIFTPFALVGLIFDAQRGLIRTVRPLPIPQRQQAIAWWFLGVIAAPLATTVTLPAGALLYGLRHVQPLVPIPSGDAVTPFVFVRAPDTFAPWFVAGWTAWIGLGFAALCFLVCVGLPVRPATSAMETFWQGVFGALWGLTMSAPMFIGFMVPKNPGAVAPWHWIVGTLVPVLVVVSYFAAPDLSDRRAGAMSAGQRPAPSPAAERAPTGFTGIPLFLVTILGRMLILLAAMAGMQFLFFKMLGAGMSHDGNPVFSTQLVSFAILFGAIPAETMSLRVLRTLPLSTMRLAMLLLATPVTLAVACALLVGWAGGMSDPALPPALNFLARTLTVAAVATLAMASTLYFNSSLRFVALVFLAFLPAFGFFFFPKIAIWLLPGGGAVIAFSAWLLVRGLRRSSAFYQPRRIFGMTVGQPFAAR